MIYKFFDARGLSEQMIAKYYPMLGDRKKKLVAEMKTPLERSAALCAEMLCRELLSELTDAPESVFDLLIRPNEVCAVSNFTARLSVAEADGLVFAAASRAPVGAAVVKPEAFSFQSAQRICSDRELRDIFSESVYSFAEIIRADTVTDASAVKKYALYLALKQSYLRARGRSAAFIERAGGFSRENGAYICDDIRYSSEVFEEKDAYCAVAERKEQA